jgi:hypothetical protein
LVVVSNRTYALPGPAAGAAGAAAAFEVPCSLSGDALGVTAGAAAVPLVLNGRSKTRSK